MKDRKDIQDAQNELNMANGEGGHKKDERHELLEAITEDTAFYMLKIPNEDCLNNSLIINEIALMGRTAKVLQEALERL